jgi:phosphatidylserine synthase
MPQARTAWIRLRHTYTGYSIGCAAVWALILVVAQRRLDSQSWNTLRLVCGGWWSGWTAATIARVSFPPPKKLTPGTEKRLGIVSIVLIAVGLTSVIRLLTTGKRPAPAP